MCCLVLQVKTCADLINDSPDTNKCPASFDTQPNSTVIRLPVNFTRDCCTAPAPVPATCNNTTPNEKPGVQFDCSVFKDGTYVYNPSNYWAPPGIDCCTVSIPLATLLHTNPCLKVDRGKP